MQWVIKDLEDINRVAAEFLTATSGDTLFAFYGPMGVGKTTFLKAVAHCLDVVDDVTSPTFAIVNEYITRKKETIYHFDFYRVKDITEALDFGVEEYLYSGNRCFIEWPELIEPLLTERVVVCRFEQRADESRVLTIEKITDSVVV